MKNHFSFRMYILAFVILSLFTAIIGRLFFLQIMEGKLYKAQALGQQVSLDAVNGERGQIFCQNTSKGGDTKMKSLSVNKDQWVVMVDPTKIEDKESFASLLSPYLQIVQKDIVAMLNQDSEGLILSKEVSLDQITKIQTLNLENIWWYNNPSRIYPQGEFLSQTIGFLGGEGVGQYGLEGYYEDILKGKSGVQKLAKGLASIFSNQDENFNGSDLYLTVDYNIQFQAEKLLKEAFQRFKIKSGQIIVIKPDSGKIIALANYPSFNLNEYYKNKDLDILQNAAIQKLFEPGSIMKPFTMATALNEGKITPTTIYVDTGSMEFSGKTIKNFEDKAYGKMTMTQVLENSINTGAVFASRQVDKRKLLEYFQKFGFFEKTDIDLQGEVASKNPSLTPNAPDINFATAAFGQGIEMTSIQMVRAFCALANGGRLVTPYIVDKIVSSDGEIQTTKPEISDPVMSQKTVNDLRDMLIGVVDNGFNGLSKIPGYYFAGKTGTAQIPLKDRKGYEPDDKTIQSFVGYGPAYNPQFLVMVKLDEPQVPSSSLSAVPIFKELANYIINYWQIPPDYEVEKK